MLEVRENQAELREYQVKVPTDAGWIDGEINTAKLQVKKVAFVAGLWLESGF
ncbi:hypothetical protein GO755_27715 [Spirosoma sp. HMF4905]|uniref:Uncharacterized protein n=1 Tax=Spirosoma arboris TaxID=2682092 RepID=A0A7K1SJB0_9BACT|nr:hypothetical protein [Spirosoma arboris]MVM33855.1 hypothetical protein [Spirosoma arboris]